MGGTLPVVFVPRGFAAEVRDRFSARESGAKASTACPPPRCLCRTGERGGINRQTSGRRSFFELGPETAWGTIGAVAFSGEYWGMHVWRRRAFRVWNASLRAGCYFGGELRLSEDH